MTRWFDLFNHNQYERKHCGWAWLIRGQALQFLWDLVHILMHALNNFSRPYGRLLLLEKPGSILLKVKNTKQKIILVLFIKMMTRQRIRANYCLKDLVTFYWMTKIQKKYEFVAWNNLVPFYWMKKLLRKVDLKQWVADTGKKNMKHTDIATKLC